MQDIFIYCLEWADIIVAYKTSTCIIEAAWRIALCQHKKLGRVAVDEQMQVEMVRAPCVLAQWRGSGWLSA